MNAYEEKQERRRERFEELAAKASEESDALATKSHRMMDAIPMGQPILVGHHSERRDRNYRDRAWNTMGKAVEAGKKAQYYAGRAASVGSAGISSDDPDAVEKLKAELEDLQRNHELMKDCNAIIREKVLVLTSEEKVERMVDLGLSQESAWRALTPDFCKRIGFPAYVLTNSSSNMRRISQRIEQLSKVDRQREPQVITGDGWTVREDIDDNRLCIEFPGKPPEELRAKLKRNAFKWSPTRGAWVRMLTPAAWYGAEDALGFKRPCPAN